MMILGADAVLETVKMIDAGTVEPKPQDDSLATSAPKIFREDGRIDWTRSAADIHNHSRGLSPYPGAWTHHNGTLIKLYRSRPIARSGAPGEAIAAEQFIVGCGDGDAQILELQQEGRKRKIGRASCRERVGGEDVGDAAK